MPGLVAQGLGRQCGARTCFIYLPISKGRPRRKKISFLTLGFVTNNKQREQTRTKEREYLFANAEQRTNNFAEKSHLNPSLTL